MLKVLAIACGIVAVCVVIHIAGLLTLAEWVIKRREWIENRRGMMRETILLIAVFGFIVVLHISETGLWAALYQWWGLFPDYETSFYFSLTSYATIGYGDVLLPQRWRLLGLLEGLSGVLLCGLSTAFLFVIVNALIEIRVEQQGKR
jgi:hypothetical protein